MNSKTKPRDTRNDSPIARARLAAGLTQAQLAEKVGVLPNQIGNWERGFRVPKLDALRRIAAALGCKIDDLA